MSSSVRGSIGTDAHPQSSRQSVPCFENPVQQPGTNMASQVISKVLMQTPPDFFFLKLPPSCTWLTTPSWLLTLSGPQQENWHHLRHLLAQQTQLPALDAYFGVGIEMQTAAKITATEEWLFFLLKYGDTFHFFPPCPLTDFSRL